MSNSKKTFANNEISFEDVIFADGISGISIGPSHTRVDLFYISGKDEKGDHIKKNCKTIVLPTSAWFEFARFIISNIENHPQELQNSLEKQKEKIFGKNTTSFKRT